MNLERLDSILNFSTEEKICEKHGKQTFVQFPNYPMQCPVCVKERAELKQAEEAKQNYQADKIGRMTNAGINPNGLRFSQWQFDSQQAQRQQQLLHNLQNYVDVFHSGLPNILIMGNTGTGKTLLMNELARLVFEKQYKSNTPARLIKTADFTKKAKATWDKYSDISEDDFVNQFADYQLLILDDLGDSDTAVNAEYAGQDRGRFGQVIDKRYQKQPTVITTNLTLNGVKTFLGDRAWDRFSQKMIVISCDWQSYRQATANIISW